MNIKLSISAALLGGTFAFMGSVFADVPIVRSQADHVATADAAGFTTLIAAAKAAGLVNALQGEGPLTVFAPNSRSAREGQTYRLRVERGYVSRRVILCGAARQRDLGPQVQRTPVDEHATRTSRVSKRTREGLEGLGVAKSDSLG